jgi:hypothetical protein
MICINMDILFLIWLLEIRSERFQPSCEGDFCCNFGEGGCGPAKFGSGDRGAPKRTPECVSYSHVYKFCLKHLFLKHYQHGHFTIFLKVLSVWGGPESLGIFVSSP